MATVVQLDTIQSGAQAILISSTVLLVTYYALNRRWLKNIWARMFISLDVGLWLVDLPTCLRLWFHLNLNNTFFAWYDMITVWLVVAIIVWRIGAIIWIQLTRERRHREQEEHDGTIRTSPLEGPGTKHGAGGDDQPSAVRPAHPGGNGERD
jgi:hypothetical protein